MNWPLIKGTDREPGTEYIDVTGLPPEDIERPPGDGERLCPWPSR